MRQFDSSSLNVSEGRTGGVTVLLVISSKRQISG